MTKQNDNPGRITFAAPARRSGCHSARAGFTPARTELEKAPDRGRSISAGRGPEEAK